MMALRATLEWNMRNRHTCSVVPRLLITPLRWKFHCVRSIMSQAK